MSDNSKIFFYPMKNYVNQNGEVSIEVFLSLNGERAPLTSEIIITIKLWDDEENRAAGVSKHSYAIKEELDDLEG